MLDLSSRAQVRMVPTAGDVVLLVDENGRMVLPSGHFKDF